MKVRVIAEDNIIICNMMMMKGKVPKNKIASLVLR